MKTKKLTFIEALMLIAGAGIGTGILTIPYAINKIGIFGAIIALAVAFVISLITYMFIADLTLNSKDSNQILGMLQEHLFKGKHKKLLTNIFFVILAVILIQNLIVYILCATDIISGLFGIPVIASKIIFYILASTVILFGIKGIGIGEKFSVILIASVIILLIGMSLFNAQNSLSFTIGEPKLVTAVYGLFMFAFSAIFSVVQVANNIENTKDIKKAVTGGLIINATLTILFTIAAIIGSKEVTEVATIGLVETIGKPWVKFMCSGFVLLAMFSSYWSSGLAFADVIKDQFKVNKNLAWIISTIPTITLAILFPLSILEYVQIGAGALSIIVGIIILPSYYNAVKNSKKELLLGKFAKSKILVWTVGIFTFIMAISSLIPID